MKDASLKSHVDFKRITRFVGVGLILFGLVIFLVFEGLNLPSMYSVVIPPSVMILGAFVGAMSEVQKSLKDELYDDWPIWVIFAVASFGLALAENLSLIYCVFMPLFVVWLRHFSGIAMYFAKRVGKYVEPKYLAWHARRQNLHKSD